jgi:RimJ/RimL family protein N-acetyltransferase
MERLWLRRFTAADADNQWKGNGKKEKGKPERTGRFSFFLFPFAFSLAFLGWFHFRPAEGAGPNEVELGYRLHQAAWGQGYCTEASRALIRKGFTELGVRRVVASTYADNLASRRVMEKAGLTLVRTYRLTPAELLALYGITCPELFDGDDVEYALDRADWEQQGATGEKGWRERR